MHLLIFTEISKKIGGGHYERSLRLKKKLLKKFNIFFYVNYNKKQILKLISEIKKPSIVFYDFKDHSKSVTKKNKQIFFILMESNKKNQKNVINIDPLNLKNGKYNGTRWSCYPDDFFKNFNSKIEKREVKNLLISQGATDAHNNIQKILKIVEPFIAKYNLRIFVKKSKFIKIPNKFKKNSKIKIINRITKVSNLLRKIHLAITSCGNFCHEINFFGIKTIFVTSEPREILRAKKLQNLGFGKYVKINNTKKFKLELTNLIRYKNLDRRDSRKIKFFRNNGMLNIVNLITKLKKDVQK